METELLISDVNSPYIYHSQPWVYLPATRRCDVCLEEGLFNAEINFRPWEAFTAILLAL